MSVPPPPELDATRPQSSTHTVLGPHLLLFSDGGVTQYPLPNTGEVLIGRGEEAQVRLEHDSISRRHAVLRMGAQVELEDLGSSNGTRVASVSLRPNAPVPVGFGELIEVGSAVLVLQGLPPRPNPPYSASEAAAATALDQLIDRVAPTDINVLLLGETGVGKEVTARRIHERSHRAKGPFVAIHCAALPETLFESELFGHEAGAFTGAQVAKAGLLETASRGTVLLDEVGDLPGAAQIKLLRVLEARQVQRVGGLQPRPLDVRFIAATHRDLRSDVGAGTFREDLYYRLTGITLTVGALRERLGELPELARGFAEQICKALGRATPSLAPTALARMRAHPWPGNIRELRNVMERAVVLCDGPVLGPEHIHFEQVATPAVPVDERARILGALQACAGNQTRAAEQLGISRKTLGIKMDALGIARPQKSRSPH